jgi:hypothetical protein
VKRLKADGRRATQELQHAFERDTWLADSEGKITRLPSSTRPKRPRRPTKPTPPLAPTLQSVVDHLRAQGPRARRNHNSPSRRGQ